MADDNKKTGYAEHNDVVDFTNGLFDGGAQSFAGYMAQLGRLPHASYVKNPPENPFKTASLDLYTATLGYPNKSNSYMTGIDYGQQIAPVVVSSIMGLGYPGTIAAGALANNGIHYLKGEPYTFDDFTKDVVQGFGAKWVQDELFKKQLPKLGEAVAKGSLKKMFESKKARANEIED